MQRETREREGDTEPNDIERDRGTEDLPLLYLHIMIVVAKALNQPNEWATEGLRAPREG